MIVSLQNNFPRQVSKLIGPQNSNVKLHQQICKCNHYVCELVEKGNYEELRKLYILICQIPEFFFLILQDHFQI